MQQLCSLLQLNSKPKMERRFQYYVPFTIIRSIIYTGPRPGSMIIIMMQKLILNYTRLHEHTHLIQLTLFEAASSPGHALSIGIRRKLTSNLPSCRAAGVDFLPIVVETLGGWCPDAIAIYYPFNRSCIGSAAEHHRSD